MGFILAIVKEAVTNGKITVPRRPHGTLGIAGIVRCLSECVTAIQQLRDRRVFYDSDGATATVRLTGAFYRIFKKADTHTYLQGGTVTAGDNTITVDDIKIIDGTTGPIAIDGHHLYLDTDGNGVAVDGLLLPGYNINTATTATAADVPANTLPDPSTGDTPAASCNVSLGEFANGKFLPSAIGNVQISFCPGNFSVYRDGQNSPTSP